MRPIAQVVMSALADWNPSQDEGQGIAVGGGGGVEAGTADARNDGRAESAPHAAAAASGGAFDSIPWAQAAADVLEAATTADGVPAAASGGGAGPAAANDGAAAALHPAGPPAAAQMRTRRRGSKRSGQTPATTAGGADGAASCGGVGRAAAINAAGTAARSGGPHAAASVRPRRSSRRTARPVLAAASGSAVVAGSDGGAGPAAADDATAPPAPSQGARAAPLRMRRRSSRTVGSAPLAPAGGAGLPCGPAAVDSGGAAGGERPVSEPARRETAAALSGAARGAATDAVSPLEGDEAPAAPPTPTVARSSRHATAIPVPFRAVSWGEIEATRVVLGKMVHAAMASSSEPDDLYVSATDGAQAAVVALCTALKVTDGEAEHIMRQSHRAKKGTVASPQPNMDAVASTLSKHRSNVIAAVSTAVTRAWKVAADWRRLPTANAAAQAADSAEQDAGRWWLRGRRYLLTVRGRHAVVSAVAEFCRTVGADDRFLSDVHAGHPVCRVTRAQVAFVCSKVRLSSLWCGFSAVLLT